MTLAFFVLLWLIIFQNFFSVEKANRLPLPEQEMQPNTTTYEQVLSLLSRLSREEQLTVLRKITLGLQKQTSSQTAKAKTLADLRGIIKNVVFSDEEISALKHHS